MAFQKKEYSQPTLSELSQLALQRLERLEAFRNADSFAIYHAMADEVQTAAFLEKWVSKKTIYLPVIIGDTLQLCPYKEDSVLKSGVFGILEPVPESGEEKARPDLIIIPGVAFDRQLNRLGRGKGYYDRLLQESEMQAAMRIGLCFGFQLVEEVPVSPLDIKMHRIVTDWELV